MEYFMGIDIGTYESKGVVINGAGEVLATSTQKHGMETPQPGYYEHDAEQVWWHDFCAISKELLQKSGVAPGAIAAVGASTLGADCVPVDEACRPLRKAILYGIDARSRQELDGLNRYYGEEALLAMRGSLFGSEDAIGKLLWIKNHEPEIFAKTHKFCTGSTYITAKLTGRYVVDAFLAQTCFFPIYDEAGAFRRDMVGSFFREDQVAEVRQTTEIVGRVTLEAAEATGLAPGTPVTTGTDDAAAEALSSGVLSQGDMMVMLGSSMYLICLTDRPVKDRRMWSSGYVIPGMHSIQGATNNAGTLTRWLRDNLFADYGAAADAGGQNAFEAMMADGRRVPPGCDGLVALPYFAGERSPLDDPKAKGMFFGLGLHHTRAHLYRACLEATAYSLRQHLDILKEHDVLPKRLLAVGGGTKNPLWIQTMADVTGQAVAVPAVNIGASYGDALMAAIAVGRYKDFAALREVIKIGARYEPDADVHASYEPYYGVFQELYPANRELMHRL